MSPGRGSPGRTSSAGCRSSIPGAVRAALADPARTDHLVGVRHLVHDEPDAGFLDRPEVARSLDLLAAAGLPLDVPDAFERHMGQVVRVAQRHPGLTVVLDHLGKPPLGDADAMGRWQEQLEQIAACPNVVAEGFRARHQRRRGLHRGGGARSYPVRARIA